MPITLQGYVKSSVDELKQRLEARLLQNVPNWKKTTADVQSNILDASVVGLLEYENIAADIINAYTPDYANDFFWNIFADNLNLNRRAKFKAQVLLLFSGPKDTIIPRNTTVSDGSVEFKTEETAVIPLTGEVYITAYSEDEVSAAPNTLTQIVEVFNNEVSVTNPSSSLAAIPEDSIEILKAKTQEKLRSSKNGSIALAHSRLLEIEGVNARLIKFKLINYMVQETVGEAQVFKEIQGIEAIIGGGDPSEVALTLFKSFLETKKLRSEPSDNDTNRTIECSLKYFNTPILVKWTAPKEIPLQITANIGFTSVTLSSEAFTLTVKSALQEYIETLQVGSPFSSRVLDTIIYQELEKVAITPDMIFELNYKLYIGPTQVYFNNQGFLEQIKDDCYISLVGFNSTIVVNPNA